MAAQFSGMPGAMAGSHMTSPASNMAAMGPSPHAQQAMQRIPGMTSDYNVNLVSDDIHYILTVTSSKAKKDNNIYSYSA